MSFLSNESETTFTTMKTIMAIVLSMLFVCFAGVSSETHAAPTDEGYSLEISDLDYVTQIVAVETANLQLNMSVYDEFEVISEWGEFETISLSGHAAIHSNNQWSPKVYTPKLPPAWRLYESIWYLPQFC